MMQYIKDIWTHSIRRQLILGIALVHAVLMTIFVFDLVTRQSDFLKEQSRNQTLGLTQTLAANSVSWVLSQDFIGMEEIIHSQSQQPNLNYAMILSPMGEVLAHTNTTNVGLYISDTLSLSLLKCKRISQVLVDDNSLIDIASPIFANEKFIGWARVGMSQQVISDGLATITKDGIWYTILAIIVGSIFAIIMGRGITLGLEHLVTVADEIREGNEEARISLDRKDELGKLGENLNAMIDSIIKQKNIIKETQKELIVAKELAERANEAKSLFLTSMSHELRTPLNGIMGFTQLFKHDKSLNPKQNQGVDVIHKSAEHLLALVNDILDFSKMDHDKLKLIKTEFYLHEFLNVLTQASRIDAEKKALLFDYQENSELPKVISTDKVRLKQVLLNLLSNAIKFTEKGEVKFVVTSNSEASNKVNLTFEIIDSGIGIAPGMHEKIFDSFQQVSNPKIFREGAGLGLAISKKLVDQLGGKLMLESPFYDSEKEKNLSPGSRFYFEIEVRTLTALNKNEEDNLVKGISSFRVNGNENQKLSILIIDDTKTNRFVLNRLLSRVGFSVTEASGGKEAISLCENNEYDLIFLDILMPGIDGFETAKRIKENSNYKDIPIVALSALVDRKDETVIKCTNAGCIDLVPKPFYEETIFSKLIKYLPIYPIYEGEYSVLKVYEKVITLPKKEDRQQIFQLSQEGDISGLNLYLEKLERKGNGKYTTFTDKIKVLAEDFQFEEIEKFINQKIKS